MITVFVINRLLLSFCLLPKVITLSGFHCISDEVEEITGEKPMLVSCRTSVYSKKRNVLVRLTKEQYYKIDLKPLPKEVCVSFRHDLHALQSSQEGDTFQKALQLYVKKWTAACFGSNLLCRNATVDEERKLV